ncbi:uncharacterized protein LOC132727561 [Ruditapes philippinarum]|uniref:uncharacterized protein LOC132727561 n=1 Tax=Ruditapes philippinarum TaxID=129788 RepID=UPI00295BB9A4|nr:uncharacterized protein LOC132727561 [Ruditapes philippinarum]
MAARNQFRLVRTKSRTFQIRYIPDYGNIPYAYHTSPHSPDFKDEVLSPEVRKPEIQVHSWVSNQYPQYRLYRPTPYFNTCTISIGISLHLKENKEIDKKDKLVKEEKEDIATTTKESDQENDKKKKKKKIKLPSCFGFISTWVAKRKEKRREKKRKAIASRAPTPTLVQYEHRKARGGESFTIEVDCKPIVMKPILPPIKKADGPIRLACEARQEKAEAKRNEELSKKKVLAREHQRKKTECKQRKDESEHRFQERVRLTIRYRQADAERNRSRMSSQRASNSRMSTRARSSLAVSSSSESVDEGNNNALKVGSSH